MWAAKILLILNQIHSGVLPSDPPQTSCHAEQEAESPFDPPVGFSYMSTIPLAPPHLKRNLWKYFWCQKFLGNITPSRISYHCVNKLIGLLHDSKFWYLGEKRYHYRGKCVKGRCADDRFFFRICLEKVFLLREDWCVPFAWDYLVKILTLFSKVVQRLHGLQML